MLAFRRSCGDCYRTTRGSWSVGEESFTCLHVTRSTYLPTSGGISPVPSKCSSLMWPLTTRTMESSGSLKEKLRNNFANFERMTPRGILSSRRVIGLWPEATRSSHFYTRAIAGGVQGEQLLPTEY